MSDAWVHFQNKRAARPITQVFAFIYRSRYVVRREHEPGRLVGGRSRLVLGAVEDPERPDKDNNLKKDTLEPETCDPGRSL